MSSNLRLINWGPKAITPTLNEKDLGSVKESSAPFNYYPFTTSVPRDPSGPGGPGVWGRDNSLRVRPTGGGATLTYDNLQDPEGAAPNNELLLWIFPEFLVFSQFDKQLATVKPNN